MKNFNTILLLFVLSFINSIGLSQKTDTAFVILKKNKRVLKRKKIVFCYVKKIKGNSLYKEKSCKAEKDSYLLMDSLIGVDSYFVFMNNKGNKTEEGYWGRECYTHGKFISYHKNGKIKEMGSYDLGNKIGIWKTYDCKSNLILEIDYDKDVIWKN